MKIDLKGLKHDTPGGMIRGLHGSMKWTDRECITGLAASKIDGEIWRNHRVQRHLPGEMTLQQLRMADPLLCSHAELKLRRGEEIRVSTQNDARDFENDALPHLNSAYNLARWLTRNDQDAEDIVQEAYLRAFKSFCRFRGGDARPWLLRIVRNVYYTSSRKSSPQQFIDFEEDLITSDRVSPNAEEVLIQESNGRLLRKALETLPTRAREILTLRELEGMPYKEIAMVTGVPAGTVMSTLSRARAHLRRSVTDLMKTRLDAGDGFEAR